MFGLGRVFPVVRVLAVFMNIIGAFVFYFVAVAGHRVLFSPKSSVSVAEWKDFVPSKPMMRLNTNLFWEANEKHLQTTNTQKTRT